MFPDIVKNQYIGKSKIDFTYQGKPIDGTNIIQDICLPLKRLIKDNKLNCYMPDYFVIGKVTDICTMDIWIPEISKGDILYITGIPKYSMSLSSYKLKNIQWDSYYEDKYRGYLFQMARVQDPVQLVQDIRNKSSFKLNFNKQYDSNRLYT